MDERKDLKYIIKTCIPCAREKERGSMSKNPCQKQQQHQQCHQKFTTLRFFTKNLLDDCFRRLNISLRVCRTYGSYSFTGTRHLSMVRIQFVNCWFACSSSDLTKCVYAQFVMYTLSGNNAHCIKIIFHRLIYVHSIPSPALISVHSVFPFCSLIHVYMFLFMCGVCVRQCQYAFIVTVFRKRNVSWT